MAKEERHEEKGMMEKREPRYHRMRERTNLERDLNELRRNMVAWMTAPFGWMQPRDVVRMPDVDVIDKGNEFVVEADLPGVDKNDVDINVTDDTIEISAEKRQEKTGENEGYVERERTYRGYYRTIPLPDEVNPDKADAEMKNGMLKITLPKKTPTRLEGRKMKPK